MERRAIKEEWKPPEGSPVQNACQACGTDLTEVTLGALLPGGGLLIVQPLRCPACETALFYVNPQQVQPIMRVDGDLRKFLGRS